MAYRYHSRRSIKRLARKSKRNFFITLTIVALISYFSLTWILPNFIGGIGIVTNIVKPSQKTVTQSSENAGLAPPVLNIPYEATSTAEISIAGFGTSNSKVKLYIDDETKQTIDVSSDGSFTFENVTLGLGTNNIYAKTLDEDGKESLPSKTIKILYDNEKPTLNINEPEDNKVIQGGDKKVKVAGKTDPGVKIFINDSQTIVDGEGNFNTYQPLNEGDNTMSIKAVDIAGNITEIQKNVKYNP
ncbi:MAG: hypothetical protein Q8P87_01025 [bacterium]|nr:hypothetical protein [bacterium]